MHFTIKFLTVCRSPRKSQLVRTFAVEANDNLYHVNVLHVGPSFGGHAISKGHYRLTFMDPVTSDKITVTQDPKWKEIRLAILKEMVLTTRGMSISLARLPVDGGTRQTRRP